MGWSRFFTRARWDEQRAEELRNYLEHEIDDNIARGMTLEAATHAAHLKLGNPTLIREEIYEMNTLHFTETIAQDLRYGLRLLRRNPTFSIVAILTLALGTGANAAIFQLVNSVRLRTLPVERPQELVSIGIDTNDTGRTGRFTSARAKAATTRASVTESQGAKRAGEVDVMGRVSSAGKVSANCIMAAPGPRAKQGSRLLFPTPRHLWETSGGASENAGAGRSDRADCGRFSGRMISAFRIPNTTEFAPIASASVRIATIENVGFRRSSRSPYRRSCAMVSVKRSVFIS